MADKFEQFQTGLDSPAGNGEMITPDDATELTTATRALYVGGGGDVHVEMVGGAELTFYGMLGGAFYPIRIKKVFASGTTATNLAGVS